MDTFIKKRVIDKTPSTYVFMQNKVFLDDVANVAEVRRKA